MLELHSPYLWKKGQSAKPVRDVMGLRHHGRSEAVTRALSDFGSEDSFGQAVQRFREHYHYALSRSTARRVTHQVAQAAQAYVEARFAQATYPEAGEVAREDRVHDLVVELDGCKIRTATLEEPDESGPEVGPDEEPPPRRKAVTWREVRMGLCRPLEATSKTYVGQVAAYPEVVEQIFQAAVLEGMSPETAVTAVADGGIGLREALDVRFPDLLFILDWKHLKDQLYATAEAIGQPPGERAAWVQPRLDLIRQGQVQPVMDGLLEESPETRHPRLTQLHGYLTRFADAVDYESFQSYGYPIGSGEVESSHRSVPQKRLKLPGACWHPDSLAPMVALRILRANGWWDEFWHHQHQARFGSGSSHAGEQASREKGYVQPLASHEGS